MNAFRIASVLTLVGILTAFGRAADTPPPAAPLVVHEWGTFTSFSGSDGVPSTFTPNYTDIPPFVYSQAGPAEGKGVRLRDGTVSMETPVLYFYSEQALKLSVKVGFPKGWITEWYPFAAKEPSPTQSRNPGQTMEWNVRLLPGENVKFPGQYRDERDHYYFARETDAVPVQAEVQPRQGEPNRNHDLRGGAVVQREKFLFYRGVGTFAPPVKMKALGGGEVKINAVADGSVDGLMIVSVRGGKVGFQSLGNIAPGGEIRAAIPVADGNTTALAAAMVKQLTAAGLFEKEAKAMVNTWDSAWFGEEGTRLLYLVPRTRTDELLPLTITPKPDTLVRVLVGRHDFLTPEQEATADKQLKRVKAAQAELAAAEAELRKIGRFQWQAREQAERRAAPVSQR
jgi:hypothetical protein